MSTFSVGGEITVNRLGFGAMQITGRGVWGPPRDRGEALRVLRRLPELGIDFIDTADSYGPDVSEQLIREALHPYEGLLVATKAGFTRSGPNMWHVNCRPEHLIAQAHKSRRQLGVEQIGLWQLHLPWLVALLIPLAASATAGWYAWKTARKAFAFADLDATRRQLSAWFTPAMPISTPSPTGAVNPGPPDPEQDKSTVAPKEP